MDIDDLTTEETSPEVRRARPLGRTHSPLCDLVTEQLREAILSGRYTAGERLVEEQLAQEFAVSRNPIREALRILAAEGLVEVRPRHGATVAVMSHQDICEMIEVRATLEGLNARLAARRHDPKVVARLERVLEKGRRLAAGAAPKEFIALNAEFHNLLAEAGGNSTLGEMVRSLRDRTALMFSPVDSVEADRVWAEHAEITKAVIAGDEELAALLASRHVVRAGERLLRENECSDCVRGFPKGKRPQGCPNDA
ncbi:MAG TPA: GntR family transcriptional regulator [Rhodocyclaceae bacterium]|nr:GntR family transcriptional regulator [Rhodocyclaceae bacterium]